MDNLHKTEGEVRTEKTKTASTINHVSHPNFQREPRPDIVKSSRQETRTIIISRYGMLECGKNFKGTMSDMCRICNVIDDECHRLNHCPQYVGINRSNHEEKIDFNLIYMEDPTVTRRLIPEISNV